MFPNKWGIPQPIDPNERLRQQIRLINEQQQRKVFLFEQKLPALDRDIRDILQHWHAYRRSPYTMETWRPDNKRKYVWHSTPITIVLEEIILDRECPLLTLHHSYSIRRELRYDGIVLVHFNYYSDGEEYSVLINALRKIASVDEHTYSSFPSRPNVNPPSETVNNNIDFSEHIEENHYGEEGRNRGIMGGWDIGL